MGAVGGADFADALARVQGVQGWLTDDQARALFDAARAVRRGGRIVEIGSFHGRSTIVMASALPGGVELIAIDPHGGGDRGPQEITPDAEQGERDHAAFTENLRAARVQSRVRHVRLTSDDALHEVTGPIDVLYVDGAHRYGPASADIERWGAKVAAGGTMLIHDSFNAIGVMGAQLRLLVPSHTWLYMGRHSSLAIYRREPVSGPDVALNAARQLAGLPFFARNLIVKVAIVTHLTPLARLLGHGEDDGAWPY